MRRHIIATIFNKEIKEVLRDKRMLFLVILVPLFLYPILFTLMGSVGASQREKITTEKLELWLNPEAKGSMLHEMLEKDEYLNISFKSFTEEELSEQKKTLAISYIPQNDTSQHTTQHQVKLYADYSQDILSIRARQLNGQLSVLNQQLVQQRLSKQNLPTSFTEAISVQTVDLAPQETDNTFLSFIPTMIFLFIFMGCIYIAIDITAGEKERKTLQTLFTTTATTKEIIAGKFFAVLSVGLVSALANLVSLLVGMRLQASMSGIDESGMNLSLGLPHLFWFVLIVITVSVFIAAMVLAILLLANTYKESQGYMSPLMMVVLLPTIMATMPGMELDMQNAFVPIFNASLALKDLFRGEINVMLLSLTVFSGVVFSALALYLASLTFGNENVITGQKVEFKDLFKRS